MLKTKFLLLFVLLSVSLSVNASAQSRIDTSSVPADWTRPFPPFRIAGNLYYVGTWELGCYLIVTGAGNILINTGAAGSAPLIRRNVAQLGFRLSDTKILLTSQAHKDHVGAMTEIKRITHAKFFVDAGDSAVVADGGRSDYAGAGRFEPIPVDGYLVNGDSLALGGTVVKLLHHPGHTRGSCSFLLTVQDSSRSYRVLIANMPTIITEQKFSSITGYPTIAADYARTLDSMKALSFDIWLTPHASQFRLHDKWHPGDGYRPAAFLDDAGYRASLDSLGKAYEKKRAGE